MQGHLDDRRTENAFKIGRHAPGRVWKELVSMAFGKANFSCPVATDRQPSVPFSPYKIDMAVPQKPHAFLEIFPHNLAPEPARIDDMKDGRRPQRAIL